LTNTMGMLHLKVIQLHVFITWQNPDFTYPHSVFCMFYGLLVWVLAKFP